MKPGTLVRAHSTYWRSKRGEVGKIVSIDDCDIECHVVYCMVTFADGGIYPYERHELKPLKSEGIFSE